MLKAVIFDFDGVLAGTIFISVNQIRKILAKRGIEFKDRDLFLLEGANIKKILSELVGKDINDPLVEEIHKEKLKVFRETRSKIKPWPEPIKLIKGLKARGFLVGLASGGYLENIADILGENMKLFDAVTTSDEVHESKPNPELFLKTAEKMGVKPEECAVVDNAPRGIEAANKAGMISIGITTTLEKSDLANADFIASNFREVSEIIGKLAD
ncbi:MAG: HAD family phosphatase [Candidatus Diapherotrites archaeon]|nr:HAD family phosphatase [Candidatus Diapherotrites archaeon]